MAQLTVPEKPIDVRPFATKFLASAGLDAMCWEDDAVPGTYCWQLDTRGSSAKITFVPENGRMQVCYEFKMQSNIRPNNNVLAYSFLEKIKSDATAKGWGVKHTDTSFIISHNYALQDSFTKDSAMLAGIHKIAAKYAWDRCTHGAMTW